MSRKPKPKFYPGSRCLAGNLEGKIAMIRYSDKYGRWEYLFEPTTSDYRGSRMWLTGRSLDRIKVTA